MPYDSRESQGVNRDTRERSEGDFISRTGDDSGIFVGVGYIGFLQIFSLCHPNTLVSHSSGPV